LNPFFSPELETKTMLSQKKRKHVIEIKNEQHASTHVFLTSWFLRLLSAFLKPNAWVNVVLVNRYTVEIGNPFLWIVRCWTWTKDRKFKEKLIPYIYELYYSFTSLKHIPKKIPISFPLAIRSLTLNSRDMEALYLVSHSFVQLTHLIKVIIITEAKNGYPLTLDCSLFNLPSHVRTFRLHGPYMLHPLPYPLLRSCYLQFVGPNFEQSDLRNLIKLRFAYLNGAVNSNVFPSQLVILSLRVVRSPLSTSIFPRCLKVLRIHQCESLTDDCENVRLPSGLEVLTVCECKTLVNVWLPDSISYLKLAPWYPIATQLPHQLRLLKLHSPATLGSTMGFIPYPPSLEMLLARNSSCIDLTLIPDSVIRIVILKCEKGDWNLCPHAKWEKRLFHKHKTTKQGEFVRNEECTCPAWIPFVESVSTKQYKKTVSYNYLL
jgi:hypothetical protein